jgi:RimJ/RimL family protein N-acetyltransferase
MLIEADDLHFANLVAGVPLEVGSLANGGLESPDVLAMLRLLAHSVRQQFRPAAWLIVERGEVVGLCSILNVPTPEGVVRIGYGIAASCRNQGVARRAIAEILRWARSEPRVKTVSAETSVQNIASQRVLERNGFLPVGKRTDEEDGELICWEASV